VGGEYAAKVRVGLKRRDKSIRAQRHHARADPSPATLLAYSSQISHAPPISSTAATMKSTIDLSTVMTLSVP
jgi:hypothetical protein